MEFWHLEEDRGGFSAKNKSPFNLHEWCDIWDKAVLRWEIFCDIIASQWFGAPKRKKKKKGLHYTIVWFLKASFFLILVPNWLYERS